MAKRLAFCRKETSHKDYICLPFRPGTRNIAHVIRISIEERCKRRGERGGREGDIHKTCRANRRLLMIVKHRWSNETHEISQDDE